MAGLYLDASALGRVLLGEPDALQVGCAHHGLAVEAPGDPP